MLHAKSLPKFLWQDAVAHALYVRNRPPTKATKTTPYERFFGKVAKYTHMEEFGASVWVLNQSGKTQKLDPCAKKYVFVGFGDNSRAYRYWKADTHQVLLSRNVVFVKGEQQTMTADDDDEEDEEQLLPVVGGVGSSSTSSSPLSLASSLPTQSQPVKAKKEKRPATPPPPKTTATLQPPARPKKPATPRFVQPQPIQRTSQHTTRHDYAYLDRHGLPTTDSSQSPSLVLVKPDEGLIEQPVEPEPTLSEEDVDESLLGILTVNEEWEQMAYKATSNPHDQDHPTYEETLTRWDSDQWLMSRDDEILVFQRMGTFQLVDLPQELEQEPGQQRQWEQELEQGREQEEEGEGLGWSKQECHPGGEEWGLGMKEAHGSQPMRPCL
ncbi:hypothetical protein FRC06_005183, partial [Ceratobasidium sp. 370]